MIRALLSFSISASALGLGLGTAWVQAHNHHEAARLDHLQRRLDWYQRRITGLRASREQFEFEAVVEDNRDAHGGHVEGHE